jgi:hypothetical protein
MKEGLSSSTDFSILDETHLTSCQGSWVMWGQSEPIVTNTPSIGSQIITQFWMNLNLN